MRVAAIDTGIDSGPPAFQDTNFFIVSDMERDLRDGQGITVDPANPTGLGTPVSPDDPVDYTGHGTCVAGVIAAANVASRTQGVAYEAEMVSLKVQYLFYLKETIYTGEAAPDDILSFPLELLTETAIIDAILTWEGQGKWIAVTSSLLTVFLPRLSAPALRRLTSPAERLCWCSISWTNILELAAFIRRVDPSTPARKRRRPPLRVTLLEAKIAPD